jgi:hypothetical protein
VTTPWLSHGATGWPAASARRSRFDFLVEHVVLAIGPKQQTQFTTALAPIPGQTRRSGGSARCVLRSHRPQFVSVGVSGRRRLRESPWLLRTIRPEKSGRIALRAAVVPTHASKRNAGRKAKTVHVCTAAWQPHGVVSQHVDIVAWRPSNTRRIAVRRRLHESPVTRLADQSVRLHQCLVRLKPP